MIDLPLCVCLTLLSVAPSQDTTEEIHALLVTGENNHDWEWTHESLRQMLERSGRFDVDVTVDPDVTLEDADALAKYDVFVLDYNGARWGETAEANMQVQALIVPIEYAPSMIHGLAAYLIGSMVAAAAVAFSRRKELDWTKTQTVGAGIGAGLLSFAGMGFM